VKQRLLVVEDDAGIQEVLRLELTEQGFDVQVVDSGEAAVEHVDKNPVDLVLLDLRMPGMDGVETAKALKERRPNLPIVLCSVFDEKRLEPYMGREIQAFLPKPFTFRRLQTTVEGVLSHAGTTLSSKN
jgi:DNA-binding response OmpR family regulator